MRVEDIQLSQDLLEIEQRRNATIRNIRLNTDLNLDAQNDLIDRENRLATEAERFARARRGIAMEMREASVGEGFNQAMQQYFINAKTQMESGGQMFQAVIGNMEAALDRFARTGKLSFKDLARSIIQDMFAIHLKAQAMQIFKGISSAYTGSATSNLFQGSANYSGGFGGYAAEGGDISANKTYVVGERGPELFVPKSSGTVIPNNMLGSMGSNQPSVTYNGPYINNMNAIDTKTFEDYIYASNKAVWSANQYATKSLAIGQGRA
jgi:lambda family phage tail tape measure protein